MDSDREFDRVEARNEAVNSYRRVNWRQLSVGSTVWVPFAPQGEWPRGWRSGIVIGLGKNRGDQTIVSLSFETSRHGSKSRRYASELYWRKPELRGQDKPPTA
jgi:hypothetical protein